MDTILFSLLVLRGLVDSHGRVWRCHPNQLYAVEVTLSRVGSSFEADGIKPDRRTLAFLELLPTVHCMSPSKTLERLPVRHYTGEDYVLR